MIGRDDKYIDPSSAETYADNNFLQFKQACDFLLSCRAYLQGPLLDVGCGTGDLTAYIGKQFGLPITGIDISDARITFANKKYSSKQIKFVVGNAIKLDHQPMIVAQSFGTVLSFTALHHVPQKDQLETFRQMRQCLKPTGSALLLVPGRTSILHDVINETAKNSSWKQYFYDFDITSARTYQTTEYYHHLCSQAGFFRVTVTSSSESGGKEFNFGEMKKFLSGWIPHLAHLKEKIPDEKLFELIKNKFLSNITKSYFAKMNKKLHETVSITVNQNKIIAHASSENIPLRSRL
jgi:ubiquinone/menaquinone biosynthesis C-methylase UbiE